MINNLNVMKTNAEKPNQKHSGPFYISPALFHNKRLKQRRCKWAARLKSNATSTANAPATVTYNDYTTKTERNKQEPHNHHWPNNRCLPNKQLQADVTIDLLSDDDEDLTVTTTASTLATTSATSPTKTVTMQRQPQRLIVYPRGGYQVSMVPNITLIPVPNMSLQQQQQQNITAAASGVYTGFGVIKRKRKAPKPKKIQAPPTIVNSESIILTDDEDDNVNETEIKPATPKPTATVVENKLDTMHAYNNRQQFEVATTSATNHQQTQRTSSQPTHVIATETVEEVTVSLVPRSTTTANCANKHTTNCNATNSASKCNASAVNVFPMLPDETTVHTVIANRIYELSLSKLREGLASSGMPEFADGQQNLSPTHRRKMQHVTPPGVVAPPTAPISLKLSSDLSISLISDDEDDDDANDNGIHNDLVYERNCGVDSAINKRQKLAGVAAYQAQAAAKTLVQQQPQLSVVQHLQFPNAATSVGVRLSGTQNTAASMHQTPRRRKLG